MLEWKAVTGEEKIRGAIERMKKSFDSWFCNYWAKQVTREHMLSPESPLPHIYALMCLPPERAKEITPENYFEKCSDCGKQTDIWIETTFSFCDEYGCGMSLCPECAKKLKNVIEVLESTGDGE